MKQRQIKAHLSRVVLKWLSSITDDSLREDLTHAGVTIAGGSLVSLLSSEEVNDYDIYLPTPQLAVRLLTYYLEKWNNDSRHTNIIGIRAQDGYIYYPGATAGNGSFTPEISPQGGVSVYIESAGVARGEAGSEKAIDPEEDTVADYRPVYITDNAVSLHGKIQIITRFTGTPSEIVENFDFVHCTCTYQTAKKDLNLPSAALASMLTKELRYTGSRFPLCSIFRTRKYIERGYTVNAGQYLKMVMQLHELDLNDTEVLKNQLIGVDTTYMLQLISHLEVHKNDNDGKVEDGYVLRLIEELFD